LRKGQTADGAAVLLRQNGIDTSCSATARCLDCTDFVLQLQTHRPSLNDFNCSLGDNLRQKWHSPCNSQGPTTSKKFN